MAVVALAVAGLCIALRPPDAILTLATHAFSGLAMLFPSAGGSGLWPAVVSSLAAVLSVLCGEVVLLGFAWQWLPEHFSGWISALDASANLSCGLHGFGLGSAHARFAPNGSLRSAWVRGSWPSAAAPFEWY